MKTAITTLCTALLTATAALAAPAGPSEGLGLLTWLFLGFGALIVVFQCVPAVVLFAAMLRSVFFPAAAQSKTPSAR